MAIGDFIGKSAAKVLDAVVLTRYKADVKNQVKGILDIEKAEKSAAKARKKASKEAEAGAEEHEGSLKRISTKWTELRSKVELVVGAYNLLTRTTESYARDAVLRHATAEVSISRLQRASHGLLTEVQLMEVASSGLNAVFETSQEDLEAVAGAMATLIAEGKDANVVVQTFAKSLREAGTEELANFGLAVRDTTGEMAGKGTEEGFNRIIEIATEKSKEFADSAGTDAVRAMVAMKDMAHEVEVGMGKLSSAITGVIADIGNLIDNAANLAMTLEEEGMLDPISSDAGFWLNLGFGASGVNVESIRRGARRERSARTRASQRRQEQEERERFRRLSEGWWVDAEGRWHKPTELGFGAGLIGPAEDPTRLRGDRARGRRGIGRPPNIDEWLLSLGIRPGDLERFQPQPVGMGLGEVDLGGMVPIGQEFGPFLEQAGIAEPEAITTIARDLVQASQAAGMFTSSMTQMWMAVVTGSMSAGRAVKRFAGEFVLGQSAQMFSTGVTEGIMALVALFRSPAEAAGHGGSLPLAGRSCRPCRGQCQGFRCRSLLRGHGAGPRRRKHPGWG
jgi:hypothetical protein